MSRMSNTLMLLFYKYVYLVTMENNSNSKKKKGIIYYIYKQINIYIYKFYIFVDFRLLQTNNSSLEKFKRANGGYMLRDISKPHKILTIHAELQINEDHSKNPYYLMLQKEI